MKYERAIECAYCGNIVIAANGVQKYCSVMCRVNRILDNRIGIRHEAFCLTCGVFLGFTRGTWRKRCKKHVGCGNVFETYAEQKERNELHHKGYLREYRALLDNADHLNMAGFIKLQVLSEFFGRDLEEWISANKHLQNLNSILHSERHLHDMGEAQKTSPEYLEIVKLHKAAKKRARDYARSQYAKKKKKGKISEV